jgi:hypothetical protein
MENNKKIFVHIMGGIGNQLFILYAGIFLSKRNKATLYQETRATRFFEIKYYRKPSLDKFINLKKNSNIFSTIIIITYRILNKMFKLPIIFKLKILSYQLTFFNDIKSNFPVSYFRNYKMKNNEYIYLIGIWQKIEFFLEKKTPLLKISTKNINKKIFKLINNKTIAIHFRGNERHYKDQKKIFFLPNSSFYKKSIKYFDKINNGYNLHIFTDDKNYARNILSKLKIKKKAIFIDDYARDDVSQIYLLSFYSNYIIANSTFSLFPSIINRKKNKKIAIFKFWGKKKFPPYLCTKQMKIM